MLQSVVKPVLVLIAATDLLMQDQLGRIGRLIFPLPLLAFPFYLWKRSPGKQGSHYDPKCDLFAPHEAELVGHLTEPSWPDYLP